MERVELCPDGSGVRDPGTLVRRIEEQRRLDEATVRITGML
jgi:hypothetical protein